VLPCGLCISGRVSVCDIALFSFEEDELEYGVVQLRDLEMERRNARTVLAVILGGGAGTRLFPLTKRRAKPAVSFISLLFCHFHSYSINY